MSQKMEIPTISPQVLKNEKRDNIKNDDYCFLSNRDPKVSISNKSEFVDYPNHHNFLKNSLNFQKIEKLSNIEKNNHSQFDEINYTYDFSKSFSDPESVSFFNNVSDSDDNSTDNLAKSAVFERETQNTVCSDTFTSLKTDPKHDQLIGTAQRISFSHSAPSLFLDQLDSKSVNIKKDKLSNSQIEKNYSEPIKLTENNKGFEILIENDRKPNDLKTNKDLLISPENKLITRHNTRLDNCINPSDELYAFSEEIIWGREGYPTMIDLDVSHISSYYQHNQYSDCYYNYMKSMNLKRLDLVECYILLGITLPKYMILKNSFKITDRIGDHNSNKDNMQQCFSNLYFKNIRLDEKSEKLTDIICDSVILVIEANKASEFDHLVNFNKSYESFLRKPFERNPNPEKKTFIDLFSGKLNKVEDKMSIGCMCKYMFFPRKIEGFHKMTVDKMKKVISEYKSFVTELEYLINQIQVIINIIFEILNVPTYELDGTYKEATEKVNITWKARPKELRFAIVNIVCKVLSRFVSLNLDDWYIIISRFCYYRAQSVKRVYQRCFASKMEGSDEFSGNQVKCHKFAVKLANEFATRHFIDFQK